MAAVELAALLHAVAQYDAAEVRGLELAVVKVEVAVYEALRGLLAHFPVTAFPFVLVKVNGLEIVVDASYEVNGGHAFFL